MGCASSAGLRVLCASAWNSFGMASQPESPSVEHTSSLARHKTCGASQRADMEGATAGLPPSVTLP